MTARRQDAAQRAHRQRFGLNVHSHRSLAAALKALTEHHEAVDLALDRVGSTTRTRTATEVRCALRLLVEGSAGEFR